MVALTLLTQWEVLKILIGALLFGSLFLVSKKVKKTIFWILIGYLTLIGVSII